jgi:hypothetical protein
VNKNLWKIALPLLTTVITAAFCLWLQPQTQPPRAEQALAGFATTDDTFSIADDCLRSPAAVPERGSQYRLRGCPPRH